MSQSKIAQTLGRSQGTISRELKRNSGKKGYRYKQADRFANERHKSKRKAIKITEEMQYILSYSRNCVLCAIPKNPLGRKVRITRITV